MAAAAEPQLQAFIELSHPHRPRPGAHRQPHAQNHRPREQGAGRQPAVAHAGLRRTQPKSQGDQTLNSGQI
ncbi:hypothetical protein ADN01_00035 [Levilinea saccharolytica]|uniref:Uncharacterized protein n=1 Tax=Levilinea saccharolytica TaxID=229921 RepID=A0A0P6YNV0_9CHLR|nr:hypothetical protein ADN01_00035 [Levilinea saccharolytica]